MPDYCNPALYSGGGFIPRTTACGAHYILIAVARMVECIATSSAVAEFPSALAAATRIRFWRLVCKRNLRLFQMLTILNVVSQGCVMPPLTVTVRTIHGNLLSRGEPTHGTLYTQYVKNAWVRLCGTDPSLKRRQCTRACPFASKYRTASPQSMVVACP